MAVASSRTASASPASARLRQSPSNPACTIALLPSPLAQHTPADRPQTMGLFLLLCRGPGNPSTFHEGADRLGGVGVPASAGLRLPNRLKPGLQLLARRNLGSLPAGELAEHRQADALALLGVELRGEHVVARHRRG